MLTIAAVKSFMAHVPDSSDVEHSPVILNIEGSNPAPGTGGGGRKGGRVEVRFLKMLD